jgi:hypothetical protein
MAFRPGRSKLARPALIDQSSLHVAFSGCGTTLQEACKKKNVNPADTSTVLDLLGHVLMVTGAACLPGPNKIRQHSTVSEAREWQRLTTEEQLANLNALMGMLAEPPSWRQSCHRPSAQKPLLPIEMGEWESDKDLPSCLGMLTILASYGYLTGTPMLAASVQRMSAEPVAKGIGELFVPAYRLMADRLPRATLFDSMPWSILSAIDDINDSMRIMLNSRMFHGAIVLRLSGGQWVSIDPYMRNMSLIRRPLDRLAPILIADAAQAATVLGDAEWRSQSLLDAELAVLTGLLDLYRTGTLLHDDIPLVRLPAVIESLMTQHSYLQTPDTDYLAQYAVRCVQDDEAPDPQTAWDMLRAMQYGSQEPILRERILMGLFRSWTADTWGLAQHTRSSEPHQAMLLASPFRSLAVWTLINLRHRLRTRVRALDLLPHSASDITFYNAMLDHSSGHTRPQDKPWLESRIRRFREAPAHMVHPLVLEAIQ